MANHTGEEVPTGESGRLKKDPLELRICRILMDRVGFVFVSRHLASEVTSFHQPHQQALFLWTGEAKFSPS